jgi:hypothetical protein
MAPSTSWLQPTSAWPIAILAPAFVFIATSLDRSYQTDFWHHLARGRAMVQAHGLINEDRFTYTVHGQPLQDANWLTQLAYYRLYSEGGLPLVQFINSLTLAATLAGLVYLCWRAGGSLWLASLLCVFAFLGLWQVLVIRPQTFSLLLFVLLYGVLDAAERRRWLLIVAPALLALWANVHGGFPVGLVLIGAFFLAALWNGVTYHATRFYRDPQVQALGFCLGASVLTTFVNPYGWNVYQYVHTTSATASGRPILEWLPPGISLFMSKMWAASVLLVVVAFALPGRRPTARDVFLVLCFLPPTFGALRMLAWWLLVSAPIVAAQLSASLPRPWLQPAELQRPSWISAVLFGSILLACVASVPLLERYKPLVGQSPHSHQTEADLEEVADHLRGFDSDERRIFTHFEWGEYLSWTLAPDGYTIFMDGRIEIYPQTVWNDYMTVTDGHDGWQAILDHYRADWLILDSKYHQGTGLLAVVQHSAAWEYEGTVGDAILFRRKGR